MNTLLIYRSGDNKSLNKKNVKLFEDETLRKQMASAESSAVATSRCGNFSVIGFSNGKWMNKGMISKVNMQSGLHQKSFIGHQSSIQSLLIEFSNAYLISADSNGVLNKYDFYLGNLMQSEVIL